jgi:hypothetical protein
VKYGARREPTNGLKRQQEQANSHRRYQTERTQKETAILGTQGRECFKTGHAVIAGGDERRLISPPRSDK